MFHHSTASCPTQTATPSVCLPTPHPAAAFGWGEHHLPLADVTTPDDAADAAGAPSSAATVSDSLSSEPHECAGHPSPRAQTSSSTSLETTFAIDNTSPERSTDAEPPSTSSPQPAPTCRPPRDDGPADPTKQDRAFSRCAYCARTRYTVDMHLHLALCPYRVLPAPKAGDTAQCILPGRK